MRPDAAGPRTWLLAVVAAWSLAVLILALSGLGGRVGPLAHDPALAPPLPRLAPAPAARLDGLAAYAQTRDRPLFHRDRRPQPFLIAGGEAASTRDFDFVLSSVLITPGLRMAILQPTQGGASLRVREGASPDDFPNWHLAEVLPRSASFVGPDGLRVLELRVFDGIGGQSPTAQASGQRTSATPGAGPARPRPAPITPLVQGTDPEPLPMPADEPGSMADPIDPQAANPYASSNEPVLSSDEQMEAIRRRIEARRAELREAQDAPASPDQTR